MNCLFLSSPHKNRDQSAARLHVRSALCIHLLADSVRVLQGDPPEQNGLVLRASFPMFLTFLHHDLVLSVPLIKTRSYI